MIKHEGITLNKIQGTFTKQYLYDFSVPNKIDVFHCECDGRDSETLDPKTMKLDEKQKDAFQKTHYFHKLEFHGHFPFKGKT